MLERLTEHPVLIWAAAGALVVVALLLLVRRRRARSRRAEIAPLVSPQATTSKTAETVARVDAAAIAAAVHDAETNGHTEMLPELYLSMARCHIGMGRTGEAGELLRKSILGAANAQQKSVHAQARLALGDLAHANGDFTTACEHWQIARALFHELKQRHDHEEVEGRMLRNGCPTDWVLTDF